MEKYKQNYSQEDYQIKISEIKKRWSLRRQELETRRAETRLKVSYKESLEDIENFIDDLNRIQKYRLLANCRENERDKPSDISPEAKNGL